MSGISRLANQFLPKAMDFSLFKLVVDAGGGDGTNALAIAKQFPMVKTCVFDSASVCEYAKRNIQQAGMTDQVFAHPVTSSMILSLPAPIASFTATF